MKTLAGLLVIVLLHSAIAAQQPDALSAHRAMAESFAELRPAYSSLNNVSNLTTPEPALSSGQKQKPNPAPQKPPANQLKRTKIDASMVGYIEDSAVQSQVRVRFDAGFNAPRPDRAEYFYAGTSSPASPSSAIQRTLNFQQLYLDGEYSPISRLSAFVQIPFRWIQPFFVPSPTLTPDLFSGGGISDVQAGLKFAAIAADPRNLTFQLRAYFPSGDGRAGFGTNHYSIEPKVLLFQKLSDRVAIEAEAGDTHPIGGTIFTANAPSLSSPQQFAADVAMYGIGPSYQFIRRDSYRITPVLELVSWHVFGGLQTGPDKVVQSASGINVLNAKFGARASFSNGSSIYAGYGRGVTSDIWYRNLFRIEYRRVF